MSSQGSRSRQSRRSLYGRDVERSQIREWILALEPVIRISGPPGVGKTALARAAVRGLPGREVLLVDLGGAETLDEVRGRLADALHVRREVVDDAGARDELLAARAPMILVLDDADALDDESERWVSELPDEISCVLTTRVLGEPRGRRLELAGLPRPAAERMVRDAIERLAPSYRPGAGEAAALTRVLELVGRFPLGIELAAARIALLGTAHALLEDASSNALADLTGLIEACVATLEEPARGALAAWSVFDREFDTALAAAALGASREVAGERIVTLREASLLAVADARGEAAARYVIRAPIRAVAAMHATPATHRRALEGALSELADRAARALDEARGDAGELLPYRALLEAGGELDPSAWLVCYAALEQLSWQAQGWLRERSGLALERAEAAPAEIAASARVALSRLGDTGPEERVAMCREAARQFEEAGMRAWEARAERYAALALLEAADREGARRAAERAAAAAAAARRSDLEAAARQTLARVELRAGDGSAALDGYLEALAGHRRAGSERYEALCLVELLVLHLERDELEAARVWLERALALSDVDPPLRAFTLGASAAFAHLEGRLEAAASAYDEARSVAAAYGHARFSSLCRGFGALVDLERGALGAARVELLQAVSALRQVGDTHHVCLFAMAAEAGRDPSLGRVTVELPPRAEPSLIACRDVVEGRASGAGHLDARLLARALAALRRGQTSAEDLVIGPDWFSTPEGGRVSTRRRPAMRRLLHRLAEADEPLDAEALVAAGWPGERMLWTAAKNRLHVTLHRLRKLGLGERVVHDEGGWSLAPGARVAPDDG